MNIMNNDLFDWGDEPKELSASEAYSALMQRKGSTYSPAKPSKVDYKHKQQQAAQDIIQKLPSNSWAYASAFANANDKLISDLFDQAITKTNGLLGMLKPEYDNSMAFCRSVRREWMEPMAREIINAIRKEIGFKYRIKTKGSVYKTDDDKEYKHATEYKSRSLDGAILRDEFKLVQIEHNKTYLWCRPDYIYHHDDSESTAPASLERVISELRKTSYDIAYQVMLLVLSDESFGADAYSFTLLANNSSVQDILGAEI